MTIPNFRKFRDGHTWKVRISGGNGSTWSKPGSKANPVKLRFFPRMKSLVVDPKKKISTFKGFPQGLRTFSVDPKKIGDTPFLGPTSRIAWGVPNLLVKHVLCTEVFVFPQHLPFHHVKLKGESSIATSLKENLKTNVFVRVSWTAIHPKTYFLLIRIHHFGIPFLSSPKHVQDAAF